MSAHVNGYWFSSSLPGLNPDEDGELSQHEDHQQVALWLRSQLEQRGYPAVEVLKEDWGWCLMCQRKPFMLWVGCGRSDAVEPGREGLPPQHGTVVWHCFQAAEASLWARVVRRIDTTAAITRLDADLLGILASDPDITLIDQT